MQPPFCMSTGIRFLLQKKNATARSVLDPHQTSTAPDGSLSDCQSRWCAVLLTKKYVWSALDSYQPRLGGLWSHLLLSAISLYLARHGFRFVLFLFLIASFRLHCSRRKTNASRCARTRRRPQQLFPMMLPLSQLAAGFRFLSHPRNKTKNGKTQNPTKTKINN